MERTIVNDYGTWKEEESLHPWVKMNQAIRSLPPKNYVGLTLLIPMEGGGGGGEGG